MGATHYYWKHKCLKIFGQQLKFPTIVTYFYVRNLCMLRRFHEILDKTSRKFVVVGAIFKIVVNPFGSNYSNNSPLG